MEDDDSLAHRRGFWSQEEDGILVQLVQNQTRGSLNWIRIANTLGLRSPKQCRERYHQNLKPSLNHEPITPDEGAEIERLVGEIGKRWAEIARRLHGRSDNAVKNWWHGRQNRRKRFDRRRNANTFSGEEYHHQSASMDHAQLGPPPHNTMKPPFEHHHQQDPWSEAPLSSPCSSESPDTEAYHYTARTDIQPLQQHVDLPPLRTLLHGHDAGPTRSGALPSLSSLAQQTANKDACKHQHLLTAPNSPIQQQQATAIPRDSRMSLSSLLG